MIHRVTVNSDGFTDTRELSVSLGDIVEILVDNLDVRHLLVAKGEGTRRSCPLYKSFPSIRCPMNRGYPLCSGYVENSPGFIKFKEISLEEL